MCTALLLDVAAAPELWFPVVERDTAELDGWFPVVERDAAELDGWLPAAGRVAVVAALDEPEAD